MDAFLESLIRLIVEQEYSTKQKKSIEFKVHEKSPNKVDSLDRGWAVHLIEAFVDGENVGYIKLSYIPKDRIEKEYPTVVHYADKIGGTSFHTGNPHWRNQPGREIDYFFDMGLSDQVRGLSRYVDINMFDNYSKNVKQPEDMSTRELVSLKSKLMKEMEKKYRSQFEQFLHFHTNKPIVDYIQVFDNHRRQGIGIALYEYAAKWLAKRGMKLYASGIQSKEAKLAWEWLAKNRGANIGQEKPPKGARAGYERIRTFLSYL